MAAPLVARSLMSQPMHVVMWIAALACGIALSTAYPMIRDFVDKRELRGPLLRSLVDPESAQFRNEQISSDRETLCGEFNSRNTGGGYGGFRKFVTRSDRFAIQGEDPESWWSSRAGKRSTDEMIMELNAQYEVLKETNDRADKGEKTITREQLRVLTDARIFMRLWSANCAG